uniref:ATP synthase CF1 alpha subunit n=16 Tax=indigoferoid/millettioid clade TaxID=2233855 RepID=A0A873A6W8_MUCPR|nr:ATP synthase CF1 alpha subunit [Mucuna pruriens]QOY46368.1 ATP synthase CF1 alpha subunit [Mucuna pruriens]
MKNITDSFLCLGYWPSAGSFGFNTDILATNPINLSVVLGVLVFFGKGVCASCLFQRIDWIQPNCTFYLYLRKCASSRELLLKITSELMKFFQLFKKKYLRTIAFRDLLVIHFDSLLTNNFGLLPWLKCILSSLDAVLYSFYHYVNTEMQWFRLNYYIFFSILNTHVDKMASILFTYGKKFKNGLILPSLLYNALSITYVLINKNSLDFKKKNNFADIYLFGQKSPPNILVLYWLLFSIFLKLKKRREDRLITKKIGKFPISNSVSEPNESKDSCLVREEILDILQSMERESTFIKSFIRKSKTENLENYSKLRRITGRGHSTAGKSPSPLKESRNGSRSFSGEWLFSDRTRKIEFNLFNLYDFGTIRKLQKRSHSFSTTKSDYSSPTTGFTTSLTGSSRNSKELLEQRVTFTYCQCLYWHVWDDER